MANPPTNTKIRPTSEKKKKQQKKVAPPKTRTIIDNNITKHQVIPTIIEDRSNHDKFTILDVIEKQERKKKKK